MRLITTVDRLAAPGSCLAYEVKLGVEYRTSAIYRSTKEQIGVDLTALFDAEPRPDSAAALRAGCLGDIGPHPVRPRGGTRRGPGAGAP